MLTALHLLESLSTGRAECLNSTIDVVNPAMMAMYRTGLAASAVTAWGSPLPHNGIIQSTTVETRTFTCHLAASRHATRRERTWPRASTELQEKKCRIIRSVIGQKLIA